MSEHADTTSEVQDVHPMTSTPPAIAAAFVVTFDERKGYTISWQQSTNDLDLEGVVEFKTMPSGLHNIREDLVYFVYEEYVGVSAVLNVEDLQAARKAKIIAVGVLVPLEHGRMGKSWLHAETLQELAKKQIKKDGDFSIMEQFWNDNKASASPQSEQLTDSPKAEGLTVKTDVDSKTNGYRRNRSMSTGTGPALPKYKLPTHHPALVFPEFLRLFGPLVFPLVRAALLRKRILFIGETPIEKTCNYVYNLAILSSLPKPIISLLPHVDQERFRLRPLFNIGVSDIPFLESESKSLSGWIACTTDDVLCTKPELFDVLVILPNTMSSHANTHSYPKIYFSSPELSKARPKYGIRASQRDAKRFATLWKGLQSMPRATKEDPHDTVDSAIASSSESSPAPEIDIAETSSIASSITSTMSLKSVVEPQSWSRIAYTSLVWWASAGDKRSGLTEMEENENEQDVALLTGDNLDEDDNDVDAGARTREIACVQYFQRLTNLTFTAMREAIQRSDGYERRYRDDNEDDDADRSAREDQQGEEHRNLLPNGSTADKHDGDNTVHISQEDIQSMGLDVWSPSDRQFIEELVKFWWDRSADVQGGRIECCGMRIL